jgi:hypothetical protein
MLHLCFEAYVTTIKFHRHLNDCLTQVKASLTVAVSRTMAVLLPLSMQQEITTLKIEKGEYCIRFYNINLP